MVLFLVSVLNPVSAWKPPSAYTPPIITEVEYSNSYDGYPATVTFECVVQWDPAAFQRYVWLYSSTGDRYTFRYDSYEGPNKYRYTKTIEVNPWKTASYYIKAREIINYEYISFDTYYPSSGSISFSSLTGESYSKTKYQKWAVIIQGSRNDGTNAYYAHKNAYDAMYTRLTNTNSDFLESRIGKIDLSTCDDKEIGYNQVVDALEFPKDNGALSSDFIFIYIVCHGASDGIKIINQKTMEFSFMDNIFDATNYDRLVIVIETCNAGDCLDDLEDSKRLIITSADNHLAKIKDDGVNSYCYFSKKFIESLGDYFGKAFYKAREHVYGLWLDGTITGVWQDPQINYNSRGRILLGC